MGRRNKWSLFDRISKESPLGHVAPERESNSSVEETRKPRDGRPNPKYKAQYRYGHINQLCRVWMQDHAPKEFRKICRRAGQRRPTYRIFKKRKKEAVNNGTTSKKDSKASNKGNSAASIVSA